MRDTTFPATHSILSASALLLYAQERYDIGDGIECKFISLGLNDTYQLRTSSGKYILRVYRINWRSLSDILYELDILLHLHRKGVPISFPLPMRDGSLYSTLNTQEGPRKAVLLTYAEGTPLPWSRNESYEVFSRAYGRSVAQIHNALDDFSSQHARFHLDLYHLLDKPLQTTLPLLADRPEDQAYILRVVDMLKEQVARLPASALEWGACHGDFHGGNGYITSDQQVTFFDFDCCGPGWRAYDIAVFRWSRVENSPDERQWEAFLAGYLQRRTMQPVDLAAVPLFVAIRQIWLQGLRTSLAPDWGYSFLSDDYFDVSMNILRECVRRINNGA
jgi:Ser/Thr protein kinase RdoA (MazF antagonist)